MIIGNLISIVVHPCALSVLVADIGKVVDTGKVYGTAGVVLATITTPMAAAHADVLPVKVTLGLRTMRSGRDRRFYRQKASA